MKGDPLRSQNQDELKSSTLGPSNKIFFWIFFQTNNFFFFRNKKFFSKKQLLFSFLCIVRQKKISEWSENFWKFLIFKNHKVNWDPMWRISIHSDFDSLGGPLSPCGSHWLRSEPFTQIHSRTLCKICFWDLLTFRYSNKMSMFFNCTWCQHVFSFNFRVKLNFPFVYFMKYHAFCCVMKS